MEKSSVCSAAEMFSVSVKHQDTASNSLPADVTDDHCTVQCIEIVPLIRDTDDPCTTECDSGDWSDDVKQEYLSVLKQEPDDVSYVCKVSQARLPYRNTTCINMCAAYSVNTGVVLIQ